MDCRKLTDISIESFISLGTSLRHVDIGGCGSLTRSGVTRLVEGHPGMKQFVGLGLSGVPGLSEELLQLVSQRTGKLHRLALGYYEGKTAPLIDCLRMNSDTLVSLELHWSRSVTDDVALALTGEAGTFPRLRFLNLQGSKAMSADGMAAIIKLHPRTETFSCEWDSWQILEWRALCGLPRKFQTEALAIREEVGAGTLMSDKEVSEDATPLMRNMGPGLAHLVCRFGNPDGNALPLMRDYCSKQGFSLLLD